MNKLSTKQEKIMIPGNDYGLQYDQNLLFQTILETFIVYLYAFLVHELITFNRS